MKRLKDTFDKQYAEKNIASYYFSDDYKTYKIVVLDNSGLATVEEKKTSSGNFPQTVRSSLVKIGVLANDNNVNDNINVLNKPAEASLNSKTLSNSYCNEHAVYTVKLNGSNVTIYYTNLNHLDRNYTYKGYIERNKIYIKAPNKSAKYAWEFTLVENHKLSMFDNNKKQWVTLEFCDAPVNANALYKGKLNNTNYPEPTGNASPGNQGTPDSSTITESNPKVIVGLIQRSFINQPTVSNVEHLEGRVVVKLTVNRNGDVTSAHAGEKGTTIIDSVILKKCEDAVKQVKITSSNEAPLSQNGVVLFVFKTN